MADDALADERRAIIDEATSLKLVGEAQRIGCGRHEAVHLSKITDTRGKVHISLRVGVRLRVCVCVCVCVFVCVCVCVCVCV